MTAIIFEAGTEVNRIVADEEFTVEYCEKNGYTYEMIPEPEVSPELEEPATSLSLEARVDALETETAAISAAIERGLSL